MGTSRVRPKYEHGCKPSCGRKYAGHCPSRKVVTPAADETKSRAGRRVVGLPDALVRLLRRHRVRQDEERLRAGQLWREGDWLFTTELGEPVNPRTDWDEWKRLLKHAGLRDGRLHDARHTAATVLLLLGVSERTIMGVMGWSNTAMTYRYAHMVDPIGTISPGGSMGCFGPTTNPWMQRNETETETNDENAGPNSAAGPAFPLFKSGGGGI
jgi:integrase